MGLALTGDKPMARNVTNTAFRARLEGMGFTERKDGVFDGLYFKHPDFPNTSFGGVMNSRTYKRDNRLTLAHLERALERSRKRDDA